MPAFSSVTAEVAASAVNPASTGRTIGCGPWDTRSVTVLPFATRVPESGLVLETRPAGMVPLNSVPSAASSPSPVSWAVASSGDTETRAGIGTSEPGPLPKNQPVPPARAASMSTSAKSQKPRNLRVRALSARRMVVAGAEAEAAVATPATAGASGAPPRIWVSASATAAVTPPGSTMVADCPVAGGAGRTSLSRSSS